METVGSAFQARPSPVAIRFAQALVSLDALANAKVTAEQGNVAEPGMARIRSSFRAVRETIQALPSLLKRLLEIHDPGHLSAMQQSDCGQRCSSGTGNAPRQERPDTGPGRTAHRPLPAKRGSQPASHESKIGQHINCISLTKNSWLSSVSDFRARGSAGCSGAHLASRSLPCYRSGSGGVAER